jgi:hypothetical protein
MSEAMSKIGTHDTSMIHRASGASFGNAVANNPISSLFFDIWLLFATVGEGRTVSRTLGRSLIV